MREISKPRLRLVHGGGQFRSSAEVGPSIRLDLHDRIEPIPSKVIAFILFAKGALLASILYYFFA